VPLPPRTLTLDAVRLHLAEGGRSPLVFLPWDRPLQDWDGHGVRILDVKSGLSRHIVRFVDVRGRKFAVKETSAESAGREFLRYTDLTRLRIPTLRPAGVVFRGEGVEAVPTPVGPQFRQRETGYLVTELMDNVIPDSFLFRRAFRTENRNRIWDAVIGLFLRLHTKGVYWGDASLANMLIHFSNEPVPGLGRRTLLRAVLADAETVEVHPSLSDALRRADLEYFLESLQWTAADLAAAGAARDPLLTQGDTEYLRTHYGERFAVEREMQTFALVTHIDADRLLGNFDVEGYGALLLRHIEEHKWYLSERQGREADIVAAAEDWYRAVFRPVCRIFQEYGLLNIFPEKTASSLYVEIMEHKYFMSERESRDVGLIAAVEDYLARSARPDPFRVTVDGILAALRSLFGARG
jgi:hypothetical protein